MSGVIEVGEPRVAGSRVTGPLTRSGDVPRRFVVANFWSEYSFPVNGPGALTARSWMLRTRSVTGRLMPRWVRLFERRIYLALSHRW